MAGCVCSQIPLFEASVRKNHPVVKSWVLLGVTLILEVLLCGYVHNMLRSLILDSNISFSLDAMGRPTVFYGFATLTLLMLFYIIFRILAIARVPMMVLFGMKGDVRSLKSLFIFAVISAIYLTAAQSLFGKEKEESRLAVWSNMLSIDRNLKMEIMLHNVEDRIASDEILENLIKIDGSDNLIRTYLLEHYFVGIQDPYLFMVHSSTTSPEKISEFFNSNAHFYTPIVPGSRVMFLNNGVDIGSYAAAFSYHIDQGRRAWLLLEFRQRKSYEESVYPKLLSGSTISDRISLPPQYSYARYIDNRLVDSGGLFAYPTYVTPSTNPFKDNGHIIAHNGYIHHRHYTGDPGEVVIISRVQRRLFTFTLDFIYAFLVLMSICLVFRIEPSRSRTRIRKVYFRKRINFLIVSFLLLGLVVMSVVSVNFVYNRNEKNLNTLMSDKITTIRSILEARVYNFDTKRIFQDALFRENFAEIASNARTDLSLYSPSGRIFLSTNQQVFEEMIIPSRINPVAFNQIINHHQRYYISVDRVRGEKFYSLYSPVHNGKGEILAIVSAPYKSEAYSFMEDAFSHAAAIISLFVILIGLSIFVSRNTVRALFRPLVIMGLRMTRSKNEGLKEIVYERDDEIKTIVDSYNLMVRELEKSSKILAESERNKAWSEMARQVAHEIKNPLTPIKLEIQRLMRAKARGNDSWQEKFTPAMEVVLEHIDRLADSANEFSTFAKLYTQESTGFDLDLEITKLIMLYDNRVGVKVEYLGMKDTWIVAPHPQIVRVCINLLNNAVQAVEEDQAAKGTASGKVYVSLRKSATMDNAVDIVFDDNGSGVSEENVGRLFTPNFTTKSSGTGLGLAICHSIITTCGGTIAYSRSSLLSGACFMVTLPVNKE
ncbi:MAG: hypothetical protein HUJ95_04620, partial [Bacteroidales bacterium]|nr:hypothetical protein [Bacteroidales bacterium]